jgi:hypothetical protein
MFSTVFKSLSENGSQGGSEPPWGGIEIMIKIMIMRRD